jgi:hypothetical protein
MKRILLVVLSLALVVPAQAADMFNVNTGLEQGFGINKYTHTNVYTSLAKDGWSVSPELVTFKNGSTPYLNVFKARFGYDMRWFGFGLSGAVSPKRENYTAVSGGADMSFTISATGDDGIRRIGGSGRGGAPVGKGIARIDFGGGINTTHHKQTLTNTSEKLTQTEVHAFVGASVLQFVLVSARASKWVYNEKPQDRLTLPAARWSPTTGFATYLGGFQQSSFHARAEIPVFPMVRPFADYTFVKYEPLTGGVRPGDNRAFGIGVRVGLEIIALDARYQHINVTSGQDQNYTTLGAQVRF